MGKLDHSLPHPGDHGIQYTPADSPYELSETALKRLMSEYRGKRIMPNSSRKVVRATIPDMAPECAGEEPVLENNTRNEPVARPAAVGSDTDLLTACERGEIAAVRRLLDGGTCVDARDAQGNTALMVACRTCQIEVVRLLLERGADVHARNCYSRRAMDVASDWGYPTIIEILKSYGNKEFDSSFI